MTTIEATMSRQIRKPRAEYRIFSRPSYIKRFRYFIECSDWDEQILMHEKWANKICVGVIIASVLYFAPILVKVFLR